MTERPQPPGDDPDPQDPRPDSGLDVDAAFEEIVANFGPPPVEPTEPAQPDEGRPALDAPDPDRLQSLFRPAWDDAVDDEDPDDHFVPPPPPPLPVLDPRRKWAWMAMFGSPVAMLVSIVFAVALPGWVMFVLAAGFVGGFVYLVATMDDGRGRDGYDDGARV